MNFTNVIKSFIGQDLEKIIIKPLIDSLTAMNKYSVLPVYMLQFIINKSDMMPKPILVAYDNKALITEASSLTGHLEDVMHDKTPKTITPAVIVYPSTVKHSDIILGSDEYYYSSAYLVSGKEFKDYLKNGKIVINSIDVVSDAGRTSVKTNVNWTLVPFDVPTSDPTIKESVMPEQIITTVPFAVKALHLPFINYLKLSKSFASIIEAISNVSIEPNSVVLSDPSQLSSLFNCVKENQMVDIPQTKSIKIFKDFLKVKPNNVFAVYKRDKYNEATTISNVYFEMYFKSSGCNVGIFYRYLDDIFYTLSGNYE